MANERDLATFLAGDALYGDDFDQAAIDEWFEDEADAYVEMAGDGVEEHGYEQWGIRFGYRHLPADRRFRHALGFGSGLGGELVPAADRIDRVTIVESSARYDHPAKGLTMPVEFLLAESSGDLPLADHAVDLVVCFGVLHHIPNVSHVVRELARVTEPGGWAVVREPIVSLGDWARPRVGATPRERGIPIDLLRQIVTSAGFVVERETLVGFPPITRVWRYWTAPYNSRAWTVADQFICAALRRRVRYHATTSWQKVRPTSVAMVLRRE
jgi:SAM-dependent methyltransferase